MPLVACCYYKDARVHCEVLNTRAVARTPPQVVKLESALETRQNTLQPRREGGWRPKLQDPTACPNRPPPSPRISTPPPTEAGRGCTHEASSRHRLNSQCSTFQSCPARHERPGTERIGRASSPQMLLRKEVIQPHLPVRLPCYDLVLIASPTLDGSLHKGWATGFGCYRLS